MKNNGSNDIDTSQFPTILSLYFEGKISPETVIILNDVLGIFKEWDKSLKGDPLWEQTGKFLRKYKSLISSRIFDTEKFRSIMIQHAKSETI
jgi:hypothetical protein